ncbi:LacI family DNA-binding transcriptional regulator [Prauserella endophytica]|uniref:LacI family transcriptional regulator n=1 Tax=Prauserella endophytica TaxID=1592324 RepID=A0ABY2SBW0_9PSEU|nr:substrate-binding domain-containing protein [Prauserella endophytica]TKG73158.1 LacI family transcriptional regulator [Prauserella endophytica]
MSSPSSAPPRRRAPLCYRFGVALAPDTGGRAELAAAVESAVLAEGCAVTFAETTGSVTSEAAAARTLRAQGVDGVLLAPASGDDTVVTELVRIGLPTVLVDRLAPRDDVDQVGTENIESTSELTEHLAARGYRRIGLLAGPPGDGDADERSLGYRLGLGRAGLRWDAALVVRGGSPSAAGVLLAERPSAVVVAGEGMLGAVQAEARDRGLRIGAELGLVCHGDTGRAREADPPVSALAPPFGDIAHTAVRLLLSRIADPARRPRTVRLTPSFAHRSSCGCPAQGSSTAAASSSSQAPS